MPKRRISAETKADFYNILDANPGCFLDPTGGDFSLTTTVVCNFCTTVEDCAALGKEIITLQLGHPETHGPFDSHGTSKDHKRRCAGKYFEFPPFVKVESVGSKRQKGHKILSFLPL